MNKTTFVKWVKLHKVFGPIFYKFYWNTRKESVQSFLQDVFESYEHVNFIQIGANDGYINDPIFDFVVGFKWKGILFEPQPHVFLELKKTYSKAHVSGRVNLINSAVSNQEGSLKMYRLKMNQHRWAHGLTSFYKEHLLELLETDYLKDKLAGLNIDAPSEKEALIETFSVQTISFKGILERCQGHFGNLNIDLIFMDVEGFDFEILKMIPFSQIKPKVICFEHENLSCQNDLLAIKLLRSNGYTKLIKIGGDTIAIRTT